MVSVVAIFLAALVGAQALLPHIAASTISARIGRYGTIRSVSVTAWPAVQLLWGGVESVRVVASRIALSPVQAGDLLWEASATEELDVTAAQVQIGALRLSHARLRKHGSSLTAEGSVGERQLMATLPKGVVVRGIQSGGGAIDVRASGVLFGVPQSLLIAAGAHDGKVIARALDFPLAGVHVTLFEAPHIYVETLSARLQSRRPLTYALTVTARLV